MVSYEPLIHETAKRELNNLPQNQRERLKETLRDVASTREITTHPKTKPLAGQEHLHRVRVGDVRAIVELSKPHLCIYRVGKRGDVYDVVDCIDDRRVTA